MNNFSVVSQMKDLREQLSHSKRIGCFFGAGTSMALGLPGIWDLTTNVINALDKNMKSKAETVFKHIKEHSANGDNATIEDLLNHIRMIRQITYEKKENKYNGLTGQDAVEIDRQICKTIHEQLTTKEDEISSEKDGLLSMQRFIAWYNWMNQDYSRELYTLNYDMIIEKSMESLQIPFFDGFIGAYEPFFHTESVEEIDRDSKLPNSWSRLWKLHGSLGWYWKKEKDSARVIRLGAQKPNENLDELVIYPSKDKYESSRKQPFLTYLDRLRGYLKDGEKLFIVSGYSFSDDHINEIIFSSLRQNNRLHVICFLFSDSDLQKLKLQAERLPNLTLYGPKSAVIGGIFREWEAKEDLITTYWNIREPDTEKLFLLGDFNILVQYLLEISGRKVEVEREIEKALEKTMANPLSNTDEAVQ